MTDLKTTINYLEAAIYNLKVAIESGDEEIYRESAVEHIDDALKELGYEVKPISE